MTNQNRNRKLNANLLRDSRNTLNYARTQMDARDTINRGKTKRNRDTAQKPIIQLTDLPRDANGGDKIDTILIYDVS